MELFKIEHIEHSKFQITTSIMIKQLLDNYEINWNDEVVQRGLPLTLGSTNWVMLSIIAEQEYIGEERETIKRFIDNVYNIVTENIEKYYKDNNDIEVVEWQK